MNAHGSSPHRPHRHLAAALHEAAAVHVLQPAYRAYRGVRPGYRDALRAFRQGLAFRRSAAAWTDEQRQAWVLGRLRHTLREAAAGSPFWRERLHTAGFDRFDDFTFADLAGLPALERDEVRDAGAALLVSGLDEQVLRRDSTGGSSGQPTEVWRGPGELGWNESGTEYFMRQLGLPPGTSTGLLWGHHLDPVGSDRWKDRLRFAAENLRWYDCLRLSPEILARYHRELSAWRPHCVIAYAGALGVLAEHLAAQGTEHPPYPLKAFVTGAEKLLPHHRAMVEQVFGRPVHERYGSRDVALLGFQLNPRNSLDYTVDWANVLVEPEDESPESAILVTKLHADAMPMIRYRIGDMARFPAGARPGHPVFTLHEVVGREVDRIWLPDGRWVNGLSFPHMLKDFGVRTYQIVQAEDYGITLNVVPDAGFTEAASAEIVRIVRANVGALPVELRLVEDIPRTRGSKWLPVVSHAPKGHSTR